MAESLEARKTEVERRVGQTGGMPQSHWLTAMTVATSIEKARGFDGRDRIAEFCWLYWIVWIAMGIGAVVLIERWGYRRGRAEAAREASAVGRPREKAAVELEEAIKESKAGREPAVSALLEGNLRVAKYGQSESPMTWVTKQKAIVEDRLRSTTDDNSSGAVNSEAACGRSHNSSSESWEVVKGRRSDPTDDSGVHVWHCMKSPVFHLKLCRKMRCARAEIVHTISLTTHAAKASVRKLRACAECARCWPTLLKKAETVLKRE
eukprot:TRINITY_DN51180_c0_g1_i1.p1 TRINITY_DN51180_c0_g1~~TRINITY_DN51180_c0_g1_i1.p1  ORF type:complete len:295 (+),score=44.33 TRINITY_DN51180_c0_g1_i1:95-886(+)